MSLREAGINVQVIERNQPGQATSFGNAGVISPWSIVPTAMPDIWKSLPGWLLKPDGPASIRPGYALQFLPWAMRFIRNANEEKSRATSEAMDFLNRYCIDLPGLYAGFGHCHFGLMMAPKTGELPAGMLSGRIK